MKTQAISVQPSFCAALAIAEHDAGVSRASRLVERLTVVFADWQERAQARRELARLDERTLHDIGLNRMEAEFEARKPFWRV